MSRNSLGRPSLAPGGRLEEGEEEVVVGGDDEEPGAEVEGDDHAPQVPPRGDARHGADGGHHVEHLKEGKKGVRSSCDFLLHLPPT